MFRNLALVAATLISSLASQHLAQAEVSVGVRIDIPMALEYQTPPAMVWVPEIGVYLALNSPYRLFFYAGDYYLFDHNQWFMAPGYGGPWVTIELGRMPRHLRQFRDKDWQRYQNRANIYYRKGYRHEHPYFPAWQERRWEHDPHEGRGSVGRESHEGRGDVGREPHDRGDDHDRR